MSYNRRAVNRYAALQVSSALVASALVALFFSGTAAQAFGFGTLVMLLPQLFFVYRVFALPGSAGKTAATDTHLAFLTLMRTEGTKFVLVVVAFALLFRARPDLPAMAVFAGVIWMMLVTTFSNIKFAGCFAQHNGQPANPRKDSQRENNGD